MNRAMDLAPGTLVDGKYRVARPIGKGGMGAVYEVENIRVRKVVAMKVLSAGAAEDVVRRFEKEAQAAGQIGSEHIVEVHDLGTMPDGHPYMVMELLEGETLRQRLQREKRLDAERAIPLLVQLLEGLEAAHAAGIVHRDLKPENVYLCAQRGGLRDWVKILDFGISKFGAVSEDGMTKTGQVIGTPQYMAPEQIKAPQTVDGRTDLYAVGVIFYQLLTGQIPFKAKTYAELLFKVVYEPLPHPQSLVPGLDPNACAIVLRAMDRDPAGRFQTALEFRSALLDLASRLGVTLEQEANDAARGLLRASGAGMPIAPGVNAAMYMGTHASPQPGGPGAMGPGAMGPGAMGPGAMGPGAMGPGAMGPGAYAEPGGGTQVFPDQAPLGTPAAGFGPGGFGPSPSSPGTGSPSQNGWPAASGAASFGRAPASTQLLATGGGYGGETPHPSQPQAPSYPGGPPYGAALSSSSPSHPSVSSVSLSGLQRPHFQATHQPPNASGMVGIPTPHPSMDGFVAPRPSSKGRQAAMLLGAAIVAVGIGVGGFVIVRQGEQAAPGSAVAPPPPSEPSPSEPSTAPRATPSPDVAASASPELPPSATPPAEGSASASPTAVPGPSAGPTASVAPAAPPSSRPPSTGRPPPKGPKPKDVLGY